MNDLTLDSVLNFEHTDGPALVERARAGDSEAFQALFDRYGPILLGRIRRMMGPIARRRTESVDFLQGVFVEALRGLEGRTVGTEEEFLRWLTQIARGDVRDLLRRRREVGFDSLVEESGAVGQSVGRDPSPSVQARASEDAQRVTRALEGLSEDHRRVLKLRTFQQLRFGQVAERMDRSEDATRMLYRRAVIELGRHLGTGGQL